MAAIRSINTRPEITVRQSLHSKGFRFRLHKKTMPGKPDIVLAKYRAVIFVNGCFWHGHECSSFRWPATREPFWREKIGGNRARDQANLFKLQAEGWRAAVVWECALKGKDRLSAGEAIDSLCLWLSSDSAFLEVAAKNRAVDTGQI